MGTWGAGNFQCDSTLDWLAGDVVKPLVETIESNLRGMDESNDQIVAAAVEVLAVLCEQFNVVPPDVYQILGWRSAYLRAWEGFIDELAPRGDYKQRRRAVIDATFARLLGAAKKWHAVPLRVDFSEAMPDQERAQIQAQLHAVLAADEVGELTAGETFAEADEVGTRTVLTGQAFSQGGAVDTLRRAFQSLDLRSATWINFNDPIDDSSEAWPEPPE